MPWKLYLDDERTPKFAGWTIARGYHEAIALIRENGMPSEISFDHDIGTEESGFSLAKWLVDEVLDGRLSFPPDFTFNVHSANPTGADNIKGLLDCFLREIRKEQAAAQDAKDQ